MPGGTLYLRAAFLCHCGHICKESVVIWIIGGNSTGEAGMIRFVETAIFRGVEQLFLIRKTITSGRFSCQGTTIRFVGLPFVFASREGWRTAAGKPG
jgi:hypothetical protein